MSKIQKLIANPRKFILDSKVRRRTLLATALVKSQFRPRLAKEMRDDSEAPLEGVRRRVLETVPAVLVPAGEGQKRIGVRREDQQLLVDALVAAVQSTDDTLEVRAPRKQKFVLTPRRLFALDDFLTRQRHFSLTSVAGASGLDALHFEFWEDNLTHYTAPRRNPASRRIAMHTVEEEQLFKVGAPRDVSELLPYPLPTECLMEVDVVYTWVNHADSDWRELYRHATGSEYGSARGDDASSLDRFVSRDELRYSLRSIAEFAPWVRKIHIVTNCAPPDWLKTDHPRLNWVRHEDVFPASALPTFNSHAIEARLQHVPGLAEHFIYFNDDVLLARATTRDDFFLSNGVTRSFMEEYGVVLGSISTAEPDYMNAARNGQALIGEKFGRTPTVLHKHTPHVLNRDVLLEMEAVFDEAYSRTVHSQFRSMSDISTVSFLYHHYSYLTGKALPSACNATLLRSGSTGYLGRMLKLVDGDQSTFSVCVNDGGGSTDDAAWDQHVRGFLSAMFPSPCEFER